MPGKQIRFKNCLELSLLQVGRAELMRGGDASRELRIHS